MKRVATFSRARPMIESLALLALVAACAAPDGCSDCGKRGAAPDPLCGPKSLLAVCAGLGVATDLDELIVLSETSESGTTMAGLHKAAEAKGLNAVGAKISLDELADCRAPAICYAWGNHFLVAEPDADGLKVIDASLEEKKQQLSVDEFKALYSGFALLISRGGDPLPRTDVSRPDLRFEAYSYDLGLVNEGSKIERTLSFRNAGEEELAISQVRASCSCMETKVEEKVVPPGGRGSIGLTFDTKGLRGCQRQALYVSSNDPISPVVQIEVMAAIKPARSLVSSRRVDFGDVKANLGVCREIYVKDPGDGSLDIEGQVRGQYRHHL